MSEAITKLAKLAKAVQEVKYRIDLFAYTLCSIRWLCLIHHSQSGQISLSLNDKFDCLHIMLARVS